MVHMFWYNNYVILYVQLLTDDSSVDEEKIEEIDDQEITVQSKQKSDKPVHAPTGPSLFYFDTKGTGTNDQQTEQVWYNIHS